MIKVSDFGLTEDMYSANYYRQERSWTGREEKVPIKWMAPEGIETNVFDENTDVVSQIINTAIYNSLFMIIPRHTSCLSGFTQCVYFDEVANQFFVLCEYIVVIWSDLLGGVYMWWSALCWSTRHCSM